MGGFRPNLACDRPHSCHLGRRQKGVLETLIEQGRSSIGELTTTCAVAYICPPDSPAAVLASGRGAYGAPSATCALRKRILSAPQGCEQRRCRKKLVANRHRSGASGVPAPGGLDTPRCAKMVPEAQRNMCGTAEFDRNRPDLQPNEARYGPKFGPGSDTSNQIWADWGQLCRTLAGVSGIWPISVIFGRTPTRFGPNSASFVPNLARANFGRDLIEVSRIGRHRPYSAELGRTRSWWILTTSGPAPTNLGPMSDSAGGHLARRGSCAAWRRGSKRRGAAKARGPRVAFTELGLGEERWAGAGGGA